ncbi:hypothetical protein BX600DRAFT_473480 [Xylariales sp. PMI_506]|nr:hypothetical protein BX600DRAFT_473480 [Xylariales sp. PMI_506]
MAKPPVVRLRAGNPKVRTGCLKCKAAHIKCGEQKPICTRCIRLKFECHYSFDKFATTSSHKSLRKLLPADGGKPQPAVAGQSQFTTLGQSEVRYFDRFRNELVYQLGSQSFDEFWFRTILREGERDRCIRTAIISLGALAYALDCAPKDIPLFKARPCFLTTNVFYRHAIEYYTCSLALLRKQILSKCNMAPRTALICSILFSAFEQLQGNLDSGDRFLTNGLAVLKQEAHQGHRPSGTSPIAAGCDDDGIEEGEYMLIRKSLCGTHFSPMYPQGRNYLIKQNSTLLAIFSLPRAPAPPHQGQSFEVFWKLWTRFLTSTALWYSQGAMVFRPDCLTQDNLLILDQSRIVIAKNKEWEAATRLKLDNETSPYGQRVLRQVMLAVKALDYFVKTALVPTDHGRNALYETAREIIDLAEIIYEETPLFQSGRGEISPEGVQSVTLQMTQFCHDHNIRRRAIRLYKKMVKSGSRWDVKGIFMGRSALAALEEQGRDEFGSIPLTARYNWTHASWNDLYTEYTVIYTPIMKRIDSQSDVKMVLRLEDFGFV